MRDFVPNFYCSSTHNSQDIESNQMPINWWLDKENVVHIHYRLFSAIKKNENPTGPKYSLTQIRRQQRWRRWWRCGGGEIPGTTTQNMLEGKTCCDLLWHCKTPQCDSIDRWDFQELGGDWQMRASDSKVIGIMGMPPVEAPDSSGMPTSEGSALLGLSLSAAG